MKYDFIIVGQGIAGSVLSDHLIRSGLNIQLIDNGSLSNSSKVAAGLYNPITGRKMLKTWNADVLFDYLIPYYRKVQQDLKTDFLREMPIYRPFISIEELNEWMGKSADPSYEPYLKQIFETSEFPNHLNDGFGGIMLDRCGYLDTNAFLGAMRIRFRELGVIREEVFSVDSLKVVKEGVIYNEIEASKIIFADGQLLKENPFFNWLPLRPVKGELLFIRAEQSIDVIYNRGVFLIPMGGGICKVGSTYDHSNVSELVTEKAKVELTRRLKELIKFPFEIIDQKVGIRPATKDRRPFVGLHPEFDQVGVFNGLGAKGVSLAPYYANQFVQSLTNKTNLDPEVNISRFFSLY